MKNSIPITQQFQKSLVNYSSKVFERAEELHSLALKSMNAELKLEKEFGTAFPSKGLHNFEAVCNFIDPKLDEVTLKWQHPNFMAFFPSCTSDPAILGNIYHTQYQTYNGGYQQANLNDKQEREITEELRECFNIPAKFSLSSGGFGSIQSTIGNCSVLTTHVAKERKLAGFQDGERRDVLGRLVGYYPDVSHSHAIKAQLINEIKHHREIPSKYCELKGNFSMDLEKLKEQILQDKAQGLIPFWCMGVIGATPTGGNDDLQKLGALCNEEEIFLMVDAAYAGCFMVCDEFKHIISGLEYADAYALNPAKMMLCSMDSALLYFSSFEEVKNSLAITLPSTLTSISMLKLGDSTRSGLMKLKFMKRSYGIEGMQNHIRTSVCMSQYMISKINESDNFEIYPKGEYSLVCFRLKASSKEQQEAVNKLLFEEINSWNKILIVGAKVRGEYFLRLSIWSAATKESLDEVWERITLAAANISTES